MGGEGLLIHMGNKGRQVWSNTTDNTISQIAEEVSNGGRISASVCCIWVFIDADNFVKYQFCVFFSFVSILYFGGRNGCWIFLFQFVFSQSFLVCLVVCCDSWWPATLLFSVYYICLLTKLPNYLIRSITYSINFLLAQNFIKWWDRSHRAVSHTVLLKGLTYIYIT